MSNTKADNYCNNLEIWDEFELNGEIYVIINYDTQEVTARNQEWETEIITWWDISEDLELRQAEEKAEKWGRLS